MRILCRHGHYAFYPDYSYELADFCKHFDVTLTREEDYFTFPGLKGLLKYCLKTSVYKDTLEAIKNYEGTPWEIMKQNGFVFNLSTQKMFLLSAITATLKLDYTDGFLSTNVPIIQAGSIVSTGKRIVDYEAFFVEEYKQLKINEVRYV